MTNQGQSGIETSETTAIVVALGRWSSRGGPLYRQLADAIREAIDRGELAVGTRLPAERTLASLLAVSRTTVVAAYDKLRREGWLRSRQGGGTWISSAGSRPPAAASARSYRSPSTLRTLIEGPGDAIQFVVASLRGTDCIDRTTLEPAMARILEAARDHGYLTLGHPLLREAIARHVTGWGLPTDAEQLLITTGAAQAIAFIAALLVRPGTVVALEDPTYVAAMDAFAGAGARLVGLPVGPQGLRIETLRRVVATEGVGLAYLVPTFHNPTGTLVPDPRRRELVSVVQETQVPIIEDTTLHDLALERDPPPPLAAYAPDAPILTVGSLSKLFWGGLRVGWIRASEGTIAQLAQLKLLADLGSSIPSQLIGVQLLERAAEFRSARGELLRERAQLLGALLAEHLPSWSFAWPMGGTCLWTRLPAGDAGELARIAARHHVTIVSGSSASVSGGFSDHVRLPYVNEPDVLKEGVRRLARAWYEYERSAPLQQPTKLGMVI